MFWVELAVDCPMLARGFSRLLTGLGGRVQRITRPQLVQSEGARDQFAARAMASNARPDLLMVPFSKNDRDAKALLRHIRSDPARQCIGVVALVLDGRLSTQIEAMASGCDSFLDLPLTEQLHPCVRAKLLALSHCVRLDRRTSQMSQISAKAHISLPMPIVRQWPGRSASVAFNLAGRAGAETDLTPGTLPSSVAAGSSMPEDSEGTQSAQQALQTQPAVTLYDQNNRDMVQSLPSIALLDPMCGAAAADEARSHAMSCEAIIEPMGLHEKVLDARAQSLLARQAWRQSCSDSLSSTLNAALLDGLTSLFNRKHLDFVLPQLLKAARLQGHSLGLIALDLNGFKAVNDRFGHPTGDALLRALGRSIRFAVRQSDFAVRMGGDEFLVVLPQVSPQDLDAVDARLHRAIETTNIESPGGDSIAVGVATGRLMIQANDWTTTPAFVLAKVDMALYRAKKRHYSAE